MISPRISDVKCKGRLHCSCMAPRMGALKPNGYLMGSIYVMDKRPGLLSPLRVWLGPECSLCSQESVYRAPCSWHHVM